MAKAKKAQRKPRVTATAVAALVLPHDTHTENAALAFPSAARAVRAMPRQKPGKSKQDYATPLDFMVAVERRFGRMEFDLAATYANKKAVQFFGPPGSLANGSATTGGCVAADALAQDWAHWLTTCGIRRAWLNPPFAHIEPWARECLRTSESPNWVGHIYLLVPAAVGANWWVKNVHDRARVLLLNGRISFDGIAGYPKDCALIVYGDPPGYEVWRWKEQGHGEKEEGTKEISAGEKGAPHQGHRRLAAGGQGASVSPIGKGDPGF